MSDLDELTDCMRLNAPRGQIVKFTGIGGSKEEVNDAKEHLSLGETYTVEHVKVGRSYSTVCFKELKARSFNTCMFEEVDPIQKSTQTIEEIYNSHYL